VSRRNFEQEWRLAAPSLNGVQNDPDSSIGGQKSATRFETLDGSITSAGDLYHFTDSALAPSATDYTGGWIIFFGEHAIVSATAEVNYAAEIKDFNLSSGEFTLVEALPIVLTVGHRYRLWMPNGLFSAYDGISSVTRDVRHRLTFVASLPNGTTNFPYNVWVTPLRPGPLVLELVCSAAAALDTGPIVIASILDEADAPDITTTAGGIVGTGSLAGPQQWLASPANEAQDMTPRRGDTNGLPGNQHRAVWMRLRWRDESTIPRPQTCVWQVHSEGPTGQEERGASCMVIVDVDGPLLEYVLGPDRKNRRLGGSRVQAQVRDSVTKLPVPNYTPVITLDTAEGTLHPQNQEETSDDGVKVGRVYTSSILSADVGEDIDFSLEVF
jgi:hypothetical protein